MHDGMHYTIKHHGSKNCFLQTLVGLACYAQGLQDKGMKLYNFLEQPAVYFMLDGMVVVGQQ